MDKQKALAELRRLHRRYVRACGRRFAHVWFRARAVPGWAYLATPDGGIVVELRDVTTENGRTGSDHAAERGRAASDYELSRSGDEDGRRR